MNEEEESVFTCPQCPKIFATRSNLKRHMENPNIHNLPYARSRDQKRWRGHAKKISSRAETTERMRKWRAENRDKNKQNDLRCRVYRLARQKFGEEDSEEKQQFIVDEINRRLGRRMLLEQRNQNNNKNRPEQVPVTNNNETSNNTAPIAINAISVSTSTNAVTAAAAVAESSSSNPEELNELPFYCAPLHKIELPSINMTNRRPSQGSTEPSDYTNKSQPASPSSCDSVWHEQQQRQNNVPRAGSEDVDGGGHPRSQEQRLSLPSMQSLLPSYLPFPPH